jgi:hypothetical protein
MNETSGTTPTQRTRLIRRSALAATGIVVAGVAGTGALAVGIQGSVHSGITGSTGGTGVNPGSSLDPGIGATGNGIGQGSTSSGRSGPGLALPNPGGQVSGGSHGS